MRIRKPCCIRQKLTRVAGNVPATGNGLAVRLARLAAAIRTRGSR
jgi:hypothetical protein